MMFFSGVCGLALGGVLCVVYGDGLCCRVHRGYGDVV